MRTAENADAVALKLHMGLDQTVWFGDGANVAISSGMSLPEFLQHFEQRQSRQIRIMGCYHNAGLICSMYQMRYHVELASPLICETARERLSPRLALFRMRQVSLGPSQGGWHRMTCKDFHSYCLVDRLQRDQKVTGGVLRLLYQHPAWKYLSFITNVSPAWAAWTLGFIVDPRWFIDLRHPNRIGKLLVFMGVMPRIQRRVSQGAVVSGPATRCRAVLGTWKASDSAPTKGDLEIPGNFLWRTHRAAKDSVRGDLRASQKLLAFIRHAWLDELYADSRPGAEGLFMPEMLLPSAADRLALSGHLQRFENSIDRGSTG